MTEHIIIAAAADGFLTINPATLLATLINTIILFLALRHFLFKPVNKMLQSRQDEVDKTYLDAETTKTLALEMKEDYTAKLAAAKTESAELVQNATKKAQKKSDEIIFTAKDQAQNIIAKANADVEREKRRAMTQMREEISEIALAVASKVVEKEITDADNDKLIEEFIAQTGAGGKTSGKTE